MKRLAYAGVSLIALAGSNAANAADDPWTTPTQYAAPYGWGYVAPYPKDWDSRIGYDFWTRFINYYALEMGHAEPPPDPSAPPSRRKDWTPAPQTTPPYPFTEWPYGGSTSIGVTRPNSVDSPLMAAMSNTGVGKALNEAHIQIYGWVNFGGNISTNTVKPGGNWPAAYMYTPNTVRARSGRRLHRAAARYGAEGPRRLGLPIFRDVRRELSLHHRLWSRQLSAAQPQPGQRLRLSDGVRRDLYPVRRGRAAAAFWPLHLAAGHRGAARAQQLHVLAFDGLHFRQLHEHRDCRPRWR